ncbi:swi5-like zinc finger protein [Conglomerata obtusa]
MEMNDWNKQEIFHKTNIKNFDFLHSQSHIKHIADDFYYLSVDSTKLEELFYSYKTEQLAKKLNITNIEGEIKNFIKKLNLYNEVKDIADAMMGKISELRGCTIQELHDEYDIIHE